MLKLNSDKTMELTISDVPIGTGKLAFESLRNVLDLSSDVCRKKALDYGCGAGRSSRFLKKLGYGVTGVDISSSLLDVASQKDSDSQ